MDPSIWIVLVGENIEGLHGSEPSIGAKEILAFVRESWVTEAETLKDTTDSATPVFEGAEGLTLPHTIFVPELKDRVGTGEQERSVGSGPAMEIFDGEGAAIGIFFVKSEF